MKEYEYIGKAMGTDYSMSIICDEEAVAQKISNISIEKITEYEKRFSRFLPDSELSKLNKEKDLVVSEEFITVTQKARDLFYLTKGIFNPLVQIERMGYTKDFSKINDSDSIQSTDVYDINFETVLIDEKNSRVILKEGQKLDFGGFLKGYVAEILCKHIMSYSPSITGAIVNIGGDIHTQGTDAEGDVFIFDIYNPITKEDVSIPLHNQSLATSGTYKRTWIHSGAHTHHILDSSGTHNPDSDIVSSSVIDTDGGKTEAYAKVFLSLEEKAVNVLQEEILFVLIKKDGTVTKNI